ncbi:MAG: hypothetical protein ABR505_06260 [Actinomycetota bacterium]
MSFPLQRLGNDEKIVMTEWDGWTFDRAAVAFSGVMYLGIWIQVSLFHWAGGFKKLAMWGPVIMTPLIVGGVVAGSLARDGIWGWVAAALLALGVVDGLIGLYYHLNGMRKQIGGFSVRNVLSGPPPVLPFAYALIGLLGLGGLLWNA